MRADDEDALTWDEVGDPTHADSPAATPAERVEPAEPDTPVEAADPDSADSAKPATSSFLLVSYGILAGAFLLYTVGWVIGIRQVVFVEVDTLSRVLSTVAQVLAVAAPAIWFGGAFVLTRTAKPITRLLLLIAGLVATIPLPFILLGASS
jgi:hypothetical protein